MMRRETAYKLAGRKHLQVDALAEAQCEHVLRFASEPPAQVIAALAWLHEQPFLRATPTRQADAVLLTYDLAHYCLRQIEMMLEEQGFILDDSLVSRLKRAMTHFCEETRRRNAGSPQRLIKQSNQVYVKAWEHHPHGDHDDTPPELREYK
ncbi:hypothetical protein ACFONG_16220 [Uliginosibacterium paludis]|uniref:Uncharacterized protein n=1 Tax=Uliginosibacterium paludis TaxID=1615952 RepID=A0ABV2CTS5_9RHOO